MAAERVAAVATIENAYEAELRDDADVSATIDTLIRIFNSAPGPVARGHKNQVGVQDAFSPGVEDACDGGVGNGSRAVVPGAEERSAVAGAPDGAVAGDAVRGVIEQRHMPGLAGDHSTGQPVKELGLLLQ